MKQRDKVNRRLGRLNQKYPGFEKRYSVDLTYKEKGVVTAMSWQRVADAEETRSKMHGKYFLQTSLDENDEKNIWLLYNVPPRPARILGGVGHTIPAKEERHTRQMGRTAAHHERATARHNCSRADKRT